MDVKEPNGQKVFDERQQGVRERQGAHWGLVPLGGDAPLLGRAGFLLGSDSVGQAGQLQGRHARPVAGNVLRALPLIGRHLLHFLQPAQAMPL